MSPEQFNTFEPAIEPESQVKHEVIDPNGLEFPNLGNDLVRTPGDEGTLKILCGFEPARRWLDPPFPPLIGPLQETPNVEVV